MILTGNVMINGSTTYGLKLMEGIRNFDLVLISASDIKVSMINELLKSMTPDARLVMRVDLLHPLILEHMMRVQGFYKEGTFEEEGHTWISFKQEKRKKSEQGLSILQIIRAAKSILNVNLLIEETVKKMFLCNYTDQCNRTFVIMHEGNDENLFENIRKQAFIYETKFERILLDGEIKTVA